MTLEGCVLRISDILAYVGRDRQDAIAAGLLSADAFDDGRGGAYNSWILTHASIDIVEHSYGKPRIEMSEDLFEEIRRAKRENYEKIYSKGGIEGDSEAELREAFEKLYDRCLQDINEGDESSYIFKHHISRVEQQLSLLWPHLCLAGRQGSGRRRLHRKHDGWLFLRADEQIVPRSKVSAPHLY